RPRSPSARASAAPSRLESELLERVGSRQAATDRERVGDLAHVDVASRIHRDAMWRGETPGRGGVGCPPARQQPAVLVEDADAAVARLGDRPVPLRRLTLVPPELGDVGAALRIEHDVGGPLRVGPLAQILTVRAEDLNAIVLPIADEDPAVGGRGDAVGQVELPGTLAGHTPRPLELTGWREAMDAAIAVAVRNVEVAVRSHRDVGRAIERPARTRDVDRILAVVPGV